MKNKAKPQGKMKKDQTAKTEAMPGVDPGPAVTSTIDQVFTIFNSLHDGVILTTSSGQIVFANLVIQKATSFTLEVLQSKTITGLFSFPECKADEIPSPARLNALFLSLGNSIVARFVEPNQAVANFSMQIQHLPHWSGNGIEWSFTLNRDSGAQPARELVDQTSDYRFRKIIRFLPQLVCFIDAGQIVRYANHRAIDFFGDRKLAGRAIRDILDEKTYGQIIPLFHEAMAGKKVHEQLTIQSIHGAFRTVDSWLIPATGGNGQVTGVYTVLHDVSESALAQQALEATNRKLESLIRVAPVGIALAASGVITEVNTRLCDITGYSKEELAGREITSLLAPPKMSSHWTEEGSELFETTLYHREGPPRNILMSATPLNTAAPDHSTIFAILDITGRKKAEERLREQENILSGILEVTLSGYWDWNIRDRTEFFSPAFKKMFGYEAHELPDIPETWQQLVHPDDLAQVLEVYTAHANSRGETPFYNEVRYLHRDNSVKWMIFAGRIIEWDGNNNPVRMVGCHVDITGRKNAEEKLRTQKRIIELNNSIANIFLTAPQERIFSDALDVILASLQSSYGYFGYINEQGDLIFAAICGETGHTSQFPQNGDTMPPRQVWSGIVEQSIKEKRSIIADNGYEEPGQRSQGQCALATPILHHNQVIGQIFVANKPDGYNDFDRTLLEGGATQIAPVLAAILEEEKSRKAHEKLEAQYRQAQKLESIGRLAGGVAHDLNNLLSPILGYGELLLEDLNPEDPRREGADQIVKAGHRAADLIRQLLAFSRKQTLDFKQIDLNNLLADFQKLLRRTIRENIAINLRPRPFIPLLRGDVGQMEQVIMNLAVNAQDAMPEGGTLTIETSIQQVSKEMAENFESLKPGAYVCMSIADTGTGMTQETISHIFEPFFTTKGQHEGTGLGLATVYGIIKQHNGHIQVQSTVGKGSAFLIFLPCAEAELRALDALASSEAIPGGNETILLVEDNQQMLQLTKTVLNRKGYRMLSAANGVEAIALASIYNGPIHLLLTDVIMPDLNGHQLFQELVKKRPQLKVIYMSGYTGEVILPQGVPDSSIQFMQKPFSVNVLTAKVYNALKGDK